MRGVRDIVTRAPGYGAFANLAQNPADAASLRFIEQVTPVINDGAATSVYIPSDLYYVHWGVAGGTAPAWMSENSATNQDLAQWDATDVRAYRRVGNAGGGGHLGIIGGTGAEYRFIYPTGFGGQATQFAPKNPRAQQVIVGSRMRFLQDYDGPNDANGWGWGCIYPISGTGYNGTYHGFAVTRSGTGVWRLYTGDGAAKSSLDSTAAADGDWHDVFVVWATDAVTLYIDNVAVITKTTNLPSQPLRPRCSGNGAGTAWQFDIVDWRCYWEGN